MKMRCFLFALFVVQAPARPGFRAAPPLFQRYCGTCHSKDIATLQEYSPERIYESITVGKMKAEAADVPDVQKRQIAEFLSARPMGSDEAGDVKKMTNPCRTNPPMTDPSAGPAWNGWSPDLANTRFQPANVARLTAAQVPKLKLKWAFGFPGARAVYGQPTVAAGRVFLGVDTGFVYSIDARTGCVYWSFQAGGAVRSAVSIGPGQQPGRYLAYFGDLKGNAYALDAATGKELWKLDKSGGGNSSPVAWRAGGRNLVVCQGRASLDAVDATTGKRSRGGGSFGPAAAACDHLARHLACAVVAEISLLRASARVGEVDPHHSALRLVDFLAAVVADQPRNTCHGFPPRIAQPLR